MKLENIKAYNELPEGEKEKYKPSDEEGGFVEKGAVESLEVAHRLALLENEAFGELSESVRDCGLSVDDIIDKLNQEELDYDEEYKLQDLLFQNTDLQRLKGDSVDEQVKEILKKLHISFQYSKILTKKIAKGIQIGDVEVIGEALKDVKLNEDYDIVRKLENDEQLAGAFEICKQRIHAACVVIDRVEDPNLATEMYIEAFSISDKKSYSDKYALDSTAKKLAEKLYESNAREKLMDLVKTDIFRLTYFKDFMFNFGKDQKYIIDLVNNSNNAEDVYSPLKFVTEPDLLDELIHNEESFSNLKDEERKEVLGFIETISGALKGGPNIVMLSNLKNDKPSEFDKNRTEARNKFVVGISDGKYVVAMSNMDQHEYHRNIFDAIGGAQMKSGGYLGLEEVEGKTVVRMVRSSGDFGFYSQELLERYRPQIEEALGEALETKDFDLIIKTSSQYE